MSIEEIKLENPKFTQNTVTLHIMGIDVSNSMRGKKERATRITLKIVKDDLMRLEDTSSTRVATVKFGDKIYPSNLKTVEEFSTEYYSRNESTALYDTICYIEEQVANLYKLYREKYRLVINVIIISDGQDYNSRNTKQKAAEAVKRLRQKYKAGTIFYAIEEENEMCFFADIAKELGFDVKKVNNNEVGLRNFSNHVSAMITSSSVNGKAIELSETIDETLSKVAGEKYSGNVDIQTEIVDPFDEFLE